VHNRVAFWSPVRSASLPTLGNPSVHSTDFAGSSGGSTLVLPVPPDVRPARAVAGRPVAQHDPVRQFIAHVVLTDVLRVCPGRARAAEELLRIPPELRHELVDQPVRERWTPAQARAARLSAKTKRFDTNHLTSKSKNEDLKHRLQALGRELGTIEMADLSPGTRCAAADLLEVLQRLIKKRGAHRT
jgi:hypothetical protein